MGVVCPKHNEYYEKECRWCEAPEVSPPIIGAEEFNAHIAEAAAAGKAQRTSSLIYWPQDKSLSSYQYWSPPTCSVWKPHAAGYCGSQCTGIPGSVEPGMVSWPKDKAT